jgi:two-component system, LytTR family, sensor kinase
MMAYHRKWLYLLIPAVGIILAAIFHFELNDGLIDEWWKFVLNAVTMTAGLWLGCMYIVVMLWQKFPWEKYPGKHLLIEIILILLYTNLFSFSLYWAEVKIRLIEPFQQLYISAVMTNLITLLITALHEAAAFYQQWKFNFSRSVRLEKDNIEAKYETLKAQINPHFLFNSLNSLSALVEENTQAVDYLNNLSEFLRYMLKSRDREVVLVRDELNMLEKYLALQKIRFGENLDVQIDIEEKYYHYATPPLVLQMLTENCLKHNIVSKQKPLSIRIKANGEWVSVENTLQKKNEEESTGQGLRNISERYRFFTTEQVKISQTNTTFKVSIPLLKVEL